MTQDSPTLEILDADGKFTPDLNPPGTDDPTQCSYWQFKGTLHVKTKCAILQTVSWQKYYSNYNFPAEPTPGTNALPSLYKIVDPPGKELVSDPMILEIARNKELNVWTFINVGGSYGIKKRDDYDPFANNWYCSYFPTPQTHYPSDQYFFEEYIREHLMDSDHGQILIAGTPEAEARLAQAGVFKN